MASEDTKHTNRAGGGRRFGERFRDLEPTLREIGRGLRRYATTLTARETPLGTRLRGAALGLVVAAFVVARFLVVYTVLLIPFTPSISSLKSAKVERPAIVFAADGEELTRYRRLNREWVTLDAVSPHVVDALIATEDHRFYTHGGVDYRRIVGATLHTLGGDLQGASTLTMQLARNLYPARIGRAASISRKLKEMITAYKIEAVYEKDEILETYLNTVPFLYNAFGIEMASRTYYDKSAEDLDVQEAATLVGMLKGTWYYNPVRHPERSQARRNVVLAQMVKHGTLDAARFAALKDAPLGLDFEVQALRKSQAPHFTEHVRRWLSAWADEHGYNIYTDGLTVHTTLDLNLQRMAQEAAERQGDALQAVADVEWGRAGLQRISSSTGPYASQRRNVQPFSHFWRENDDVVQAFVQSTDRYQRGRERGLASAALLDSLRADEAFMDSLRAAKTRLELGFAAIDPHTGHIRAWVGSRDFSKEQYDHVVLARRQPGSTFKPFVYGAALERGFTPADRFPDQAVEIPLDGDRVWRPTNADGVSGREMTLREGLVQSKNTITAQVMHEVGPARVAALARDLGVQSRLDEVPSLALGTSEVTLLEMVSAYSTLASGGVYRAPLFITRVEDADGNVLAAFESEAERVMEEETALTLLDMMRGVIDEGTGQGVRSRFGVRADVAGKTGTTQDGADGWFLLMHPDLVAGAWVGFNDRRVTFRSDYWGQGAHNALFVVGDFFRQALRAGALSPRTAFPEAPTYDEGHDRDGTFLARVGRWFGRTVNRIGDAVRGKDGEADTRAEERDGREARRAQPAPEPEPRTDEDRAERRRRDSEAQDRLIERLRVLRERELQRMEKQREAAQQALEERIEAELERVEADRRRAREQARRENRQAQRDRQEAAPEEGSPSAQERGRRGW